MANQFDIVVIGSGPGGYVAALKAARMGAKTAVIERHPFFGGTCLNWGCIPSKALLASAELIHHIRHAGEMGIKVDGDVSIDWKKIQQRKDKVLKGQRSGLKSLFAASNVTTFHGRGVLDGPGKITIQDENGKKTESIEADKIILAVGSVPVKIPSWPNDPRLICTSDESLHWETLPKKLLIVGGGIIGCEFACMMQPLGVDVTVVEILPNLLAGLDRSLADEFAKILKKRGIKVHLETSVDDLKLNKNGVSAKLSNGATLDVDRVLTCIGRKPNTGNLGLESAGLETSPKGFLKVDDRMETSVKGIYCIGDANGRVLLAHAASAQGMAAVENALGHDEPFTSPIPSAVYTFPEMASVGLSEEQAREKGLPIATGRFPIRNLGKAQAANETDGFAKVVRHRETDELLGVHLLGHNATEVIAAAGALLHQRVTVQQMAETVFAHPTISECLKESAEDALHEAIHLPPKKMMRVTVGS